MSVYSGPKINETGLAFYYDMGNRQKSLIGPPTVNLTPDMSIGAIQAAPAVTFIGIEDGWKKYSLNGTWSAGTYPYSIGVQAPTFTGGVTYSTSVYIKTNVPQKFAALFTGMNYVNEPMNIGGTSFSIPQEDGSIYVGRSGFQYTNTTAQTGYLLSQPVIGQTFNSATDFVFIRQGQIEVGSVPTAFVAGTRSNTQAILDITGRNTITVTGTPTYNSTSITFPNTNNAYLSATTPSNLRMGTQDFTLSFWVKQLDNGSNCLLEARGASLAGYFFILNYPSAGQISVFLNHGGNQYIYSSSVATLGIGTPQNIVAVVNRQTSSILLYVNGVLWNTITGIHTTSITPASSDRYDVGYDLGGGTQNYELYSHSHYTRALSAAEVQQNFAALRGRFGI